MTLDLDAHDFLIIPARVEAGMSQDELNHEFALMMERSQMTEAFLRGDVAASDYLLLLHDQGVDCAQFVADVERDTNLLFADRWID